MKSNLISLRKALYVGLLSSLMLLGMSPQRVVAADELTVAYFLEWPMPFQYGCQRTKLIDPPVGQYF